MDEMNMPEIPLGDVQINASWVLTELNGMAVIRFGSPPFQMISFAFIRHNAKKLASELAELADTLPPPPTRPVSPTPPRTATSLSFKREDVNDEGEPIGPVVVCGEDGFPIFNLEWPAPPWLTLSQARQLAEAQGLAFDEA